MINKFEKGWYYEPKEVEEQFKDLELIFTIGDEPWSIALYYLSSHSIYLEKSPIDRINDSMYFLSNVFDQKSAEDWKKKTINEWNKNNSKGIK